MNWFRILQSSIGTADWRKRASLRELLKEIQESAEEANGCLTRDELGVFSIRQGSEALKELESHFAKLQKLKSELQ